MFMTRSGAGLSDKGALMQLRGSTTAPQTLELGLIIIFVFTFFVIWRAEWRTQPISRLTRWMKFM